MYYKVEKAYTDEKFINGSKDVSGTYSLLISTEYSNYRQ